MGHVRRPLVGFLCCRYATERLHRVVARRYEQALQTAGLSLPQMEILTALVSAGGPIRPAALATRLMVERSTLTATSP